MMIRIHNEEDNKNVINLLDTLKVTGELEHLRKTDYVALTIRKNKKPLKTSYTYGFNGYPVESSIQITRDDLIQLISQLIENVQTLK